MKSSIADIGKLIPHLLLFAALAVVFLFEGFNFIDRPISDIRFRLLQKNASQDLVIVSIDSLSLKAMGKWPWPRSHHARVLDNLNEAGAQRIAFDLDFSSPSDVYEDKNLAASLERAKGKVILPAFKQFVQGYGNTPLFTVTAPLPMFARHALIASANVRPDNNGQIRRYATYESMNNHPIASLPMVLANGFSPPSDIFHIDYGIRPRTIPVISFADIYHGRFNPSEIRGKKIIVGATAIELGDQLAVPVYRVLPSPAILALAYESIIQGRTLISGTPLLILGISLLLAWAFGHRLSRWPWRRGLAVATGLMIGIFGVSVVVQAAFPITLDVTVWLFQVMGSYAVGLAVKIDQNSLLVFKTSMAAARNKEILHNFADNAFDGLITVFEDGNIEYFNPAAEKLFKVKESDIRGANIGMLIDKKTLIPDDNGDDDGVGFSVGLREGTGRRASGEDFPIELIISEIATKASKHPLEKRRSNRRSFLLTIRDISDRKIAEQKLSLRRSDYHRIDRLSSMEEMTSGIAHELNQPLTAIISYLDGAVRRLEHLSNVPTSIIQAIDKAQHQAERAGEIMRRMRGVSKRAELLRRRPIDLNLSIEEALELIDLDLAKSNVSMELHLAQSLPKVMADSVQIQQVILNLVKNGLEAMADQEKPEKHLHISTDMSDKNFVKVEVEDSGPGVSKEIKSHLFYPFATEKKGGTGIGLTICRSIVEDHGGKIELISKPNSSAVFAFTLPRTD